MGDGDVPKGSVLMADPKEVDKKVKDYLERAKKILKTIPGWQVDSEPMNDNPAVVEIAKMIQIQDERDKVYV